jgi:hypothetical protein
MVCREARLYKEASEQITVRRSIHRKTQTKGGSNEEILAHCTWCYGSGILGD